MIEGLEGRRLLAADLGNGVLTVTGTGRRDRVRVGIAVDSPGTLIVITNGQRQTFDAAAVASMSVNLGRGNDSFDARGVVIPITVAGGRGDDSIYTGDASDAISGGAGNDTVSAGGGRDAVSGDDGDDAISGGGSNDTLSGNTGDDRLDGGNGNDSLSGGDGDDRLNGGLGDDRLGGDRGIDRFAGGRGADTLEDYATDDFGRDQDEDDILLDNSDSGLDGSAEAGTIVKVGSGSTSSGGDATGTDSGTGGSSSGGSGSGSGTPTNIDSPLNPDGSGRTDNA